MEKTASDGGSERFLETIREALFAQAEEKYRVFQTKLMPGVEPSRVIGVRTPDLRKMAKALAKDPQVGAFLSDLPHRYYEENNLHGFILCELKDFDRTVRLLDEFLPYVDNWATCDQIRPKSFDRGASRLLPLIRGWIASDRTYTVRFGIEMLMTYFLDERFTPEVNELAAGAVGEDYYVRMMVAWHFATALAKQWDATLPYLTEGRLPVWTHNKTIRKAIESYRISDAHKAQLRTLQRKGNEEKE